MKIPWMTGKPSESLQEALQISLTGKAEPQVGLWEIIAQIEQRFGRTIGLMTPLKPSDAPVDVRRRLGPA
jgi:hypothetical protein